MAFVIKQKTADGLVDIDIAAKYDSAGNEITAHYATKEELEGSGGSGGSAPGFYYSSINISSMGGTMVGVATITPTGVGVGDHVVDSVGDVYEVTALPSAYVASVNKVTSIKGADGTSGTSGTSGQTYYVEVGDVDNPLQFAPTQLKTIKSIKVYCNAEHDLIHYNSTFMDHESNHDSHYLEITVAYQEETDSASESLVLFVRGEYLDSYEGQYKPFFFAEDLSGEGAGWITITNADSDIDYVYAVVTTA